MKQTGKKLLTALLSAAILCATHLPTQTSAQEANNQATSPNQAYTLQKTNAGTWAIFDKAGKPLNAITPLHKQYDKIVTTWAPDSQKVAILAMTLKFSDVYVLGTQNNYTVPSPSIDSLKEFAGSHAHFLYNPQSYFFHDQGAVSVKWINSQELQLRTEVVAGFSDQEQVKQDHWKFIIGYAYNLGDETPSKDLQLIKVRQE